MSNEYSFGYPVSLIQQKEGGYLIKFLDFPEAITQGETVIDALNEAADCLEEAIANRINLKLDIPGASELKKNQTLVFLSATLSAKMALYLEMKNRKFNNSYLSKKLDCDEKEVRRLLDPYYHSKFPKLEQALKAMGKRLSVKVSKSIEPSIKSTKKRQFAACKIGKKTKKTSFKTAKPNKKL